MVLSAQYKLPSVYNKVYTQSLPADRLMVRCTGDRVARPPERNVDRSEASAYQPPRFPALFSSPRRS